MEKGEGEEGRNGSEGRLQYGIAMDCCCCEMLWERCAPLSGSAGKSLSKLGRTGQMRRSPLHSLMMVGRDEVFTWGRKGEVSEGGHYGPYAERGPSASQHLTRHIRHHRPERLPAANSSLQLSLDPTHLA